MLKPNSIISTDKIVSCTFLANKATNVSSNDVRNMVDSVCCVSHTY